MCRFLFYCSTNKIPLSDILENKEHALFKQVHTRIFHKKDIPDNMKNIITSKVHCDGFGFCLLDFNNFFYKFPHPPTHDNNLPSLLKLKSKAFIAHIRSAVTQKNTSSYWYNNHPFIHNQYSFCHNGCIPEGYDDYLNVDYDYKIHSNSDSEVIFKFLLYHLDNGLNMIDSVKKLINVLREKVGCENTGLNIILSDSHEVLILKYSANRTKLSLFYKVNDNEIIFSSEPTHDFFNWNEVENETINIVSLEECKITQFNLQNLLDNI
jgi:predicted glutamine amidotransferase